MRKARFLLATAFILGLSAMAPRAEAGCFQIYVQAVEDCSNLGSFWDRAACGLDAAVALTGCVVRGTKG